MSVWGRVNRSFAIARSDRTSSHLDDRDVSGLEQELEARVLLGVISDLALLAGPEVEKLSLRQRNLDGTMGLVLDGLHIASFPSNTEDRDSILAALGELAQRQRLSPSLRAEADPLQASWR